MDTNNKNLKGNTKFIRVEKNKNYSVIYNEVLHRADISFRAKGLFAFLMTLPEDWEVRKMNLHKFSTDGKFATDTAFKELETLGYISRSAIRSGDGTFYGWNYEIRELVEGTSPTYQKTEVGLTDNRKTGKSLINTNLNKVLNKQSTIKDSTFSSGDALEDFLLKGNSKASKEILEIFRTESGAYPKDYARLNFLRDLFKDLRQIVDSNTLPATKDTINRLDRYERFLGRDEVIEIFRKSTDPIYDLENLLVQ